MSSIRATPGEIRRSLPCPGDVELIPASIVFFATADWFFVTHRLPLAQALHDAGSDVTVVAPDTGASEAIRQAGIRFVPFNHRKAGANVLEELKLLFKLRRLLLELQPAFIHNIATKPVIYGTIATRLCGGPRPEVVNAVTGLGWPLGGSHEARYLRLVTLLMYRLTCLLRKDSIYIFQNQHDSDFFVRRRLSRSDNSVIIRGAGVDEAVFAPAPMPAAADIVLLPARMLRSKGIQDFANMADNLREVFPTTQFLLAGRVDDGNPASYSVHQITSLCAQHNVKWLGHVEDVPALLRDSTIVVFPSHHPEGIPKALIEAASVGRPIVASDQPGCAEIVKHNVNGLLFPIGDVDALAAAVKTLLNSPSLAADFGRSGTALVQECFRVSQVISETKSVYSRMPGIFA